MRCVANWVNELGNSGYSGCLFIAVKFSLLKLSIANENGAVIPKSMMGGCQEPMLRINGTKGEETMSADCIGLVAINCSCISQEKSRQIELARRKKCRKIILIRSARQKKCRKRLTTYVQKGPVRQGSELPSPNQIELYWAAKRPRGFPAMSRNFKNAWT